jgi:IS30 family transposase
MANRPRAGRITRADRVDETHRLRAKGLTHREIAERLDVSVSTIANDLRSTTSPRVEGEPQATSPVPTAYRARASKSSLLGRLRAKLRSVRDLLP